MDPVLLAHHVQPLICTHNIRKIVDAGCGCGIIPLMLAKKNPDLMITGIEIQEELSQFARHNVRKNNLNTKVSILCKDMNQITTDHLNGRIDLLVSNPPYKKRHTGRLNPDIQKAIARHEIRLTLDQLFNAANRLVHETGRIALIFPAQRLPDLEQALSDHGFFAESIQFIHTKSDSAPTRLILVAGKTKNVTCTILPRICL